MKHLLRTLSLCLFLSIPAVGSADQEMLEQEDIFTANTDGYRVFRIPGIVCTPKGTLLAYCEARRGSRSDWGDIDIVIRRSTDGGKTWTPMKKIASAPKGQKKNQAALEQGLGKPDEITLNNPMAIVDRDTGHVHFLYCIEYGWCYYMKSEDEGKTWSSPVEITETFEDFRKQGFPWIVLATGPGHGIQLDNGRLIIPVWLSNGKGGHAHRPSVNSVIYSDDQGKTWKAGRIAAGEYTPRNPSETMAIQLADGRVMLNFRHESRPLGRAVITSPNGISDWSAVRFDSALPEPVCMASILRLSRKPEASRNRIIFSNPNNPIDRKRRNVTIKLSYDEGQSWPISRTLEPGTSAYSDLTLGPDGTIYCFYERNRDPKTGDTPGNLTVARFNLEWLTQGIDTLKAKK